ncbi:hypothetical protein Tco_0335679 [Tanacetum coccineum]
MAVEVLQTLKYRGGQLNAAPVLEDFQDSPDDEDDTRSSEEYMNDLEEEYQARSLLAKSKRLLVKDISSFISITFQLKLLHSSEHKLELRHTKDFEAKYNKVKAKLALLSSSASTPSSSSGKNKGLIAETYDWDEEEMSSDNNEVTKVKALMALSKEEKVYFISEQIPTQKKKILGIDQLIEDTSSFGLKDQVFVKSSADNSEVSITSSNKPKLFKAKDSTMSNHDTNEHPLPPLKKLIGAEHVYGPKTIKSILKLKSTFKVETLKGITINKPSSAPARGNKSSLISKTNSAPASKLKNVKMEDDPPLAIVMKELNELKLQISKNKSSYFRNKISQLVPPNALQNKYKT